MAIKLKLAEVFTTFSADTRGISRGVADAKSMINRFKSTAVVAMKVVAAAVAAVVAGLALAVHQASALETQMARVGTLMSGEARREFMPGATEGILRLSSEFGRTKLELTNGLFDILSAGISAADSMKVLRVATQSAVAGFTDTAVVVDGMTAVLKAYGLEADRATEVSDRLFVANTRGKITIEELSRNIGKVAATAGAAGLSLDQLFGAISTASNLTSAEETMTGLRSVINAFRKPSKEAADIAKEHGLALNQQTLAAKGLTGVIEDLSNLPPDVVAKIFPQESLRVIDALMQNQAGLIADVAAQANSAGATQEAMAAATATLSFQWGRLKQSVGSAFATIGAPLLNILAGIIEKVADVTEGTRRFVVAYVKASPVIQGIIAMVGKAWKAASAVAIHAMDIMVTAIINGMGTLVNTVSGILLGIASAMEGAFGATDVSNMLKKAAFGVQKEWEAALKALQAFKAEQGDLGTPEVPDIGGGGGAEGGGAAGSGGSRFQAFEDRFKSLLGAASDKAEERRTLKALLEQAVKIHTTLKKQPGAPAPVGP